MAVFAVAGVAGIKSIVFAPVGATVAVYVIVILPVASDSIVETFFVAAGGVALIASQSVFVVVPHSMFRGPWELNASETEDFNPLARLRPSETRVRTV